MEYFIPSLLILLIIFREVIHYKELKRKDDFIKDLEIRFASKNPEEYVRTKSIYDRPTPPEMINEEDPYVDINTVPVDTLMKAKEA